MEAPRKTVNSESPESRRAGRIWGGGVIVVMLAFILFISINVGRMLGQRPELVRKDYYAADLAFQKTLDARARAAALGTRTPQILIQGDSLRILGTTGLAGKAQLQRPSDSRLDRIVEIAPDATGSQILADKLAPGRWILSLRWNQAGQDYEKIWNLSIVP
ncbi:MAG: hypothetical protein RL095_2825 [Verrucomicrobiota bacterium]|jgi:nitrogen fixation protein FixH